MLAARRPRTRRGWETALYAFLSLSLGWCPRIRPGSGPEGCCEVGLCKQNR